MYIVRRTWRMWHLIAGVAVNTNDSVSCINSQKLMALIPGSTLTCSYIE